LALFDLNNFKRYNDTYGHPAGDELLRRLARRLKDATRSSGTAYRLGGDEFCVLLNTDKRDEVERAIGGCSEALREHGDGFDISAAGGSVRLPSDAPDPSSCLKYADQRMYKDKAGSRQRALRSVELFANERDERFVAVTELCDRVADDLERAELVAVRLECARALGRTRRDP
jgi:diguanylate cyclase (GGDEF)-like protein